MVKEEKKCQVVMSNGSHCGRILHDWENCFFHSPKEDRSVEFFQDELNKIFNDKSLKNYDFTKFIFPKGISFPLVIDKEISFRDAVFHEEILFWSITFLKSVDFSGATFKGEANFRLSVFEKDAFADFGGATFEGYADFSVVIFKDQVNFSEVIFNKEVFFYDAFFEDGVTFHFTTFKDRLVIQGHRVNKLFSEKEVDFTEVSLMRPEKVSFQKVDLRNFRLLRTDLRKVEFVDVDWYKEKGRNKIFDEVSPEPETKKFSYPLIAQVYKRLRANYEENLNYAEAGDFHIGEMEMRRKDKKEKISNRLAISLYKGISYYGESFILPLGWILAFLLLIFPILYIVVGIAESPKLIVGQIQDMEKLKDFWSSFTYSLSVFSLVRERPYHTINNLGHILTILESIFSPVMIAFFLLALRRRFKR